MTSQCARSSWNCCRRLRREAPLEPRQGVSGEAGPTEAAAAAGTDPDSSAAVSLSHRQLRDDEYWRWLPGYAQVPAAQFHDHRFQAQATVTSVRQLRDVVGDLVSEAFYADAEDGVRRSTMSLRVSPHVLSLIDWREPLSDPLRIQFVPLGSRLQPDHPQVRVDALREQSDAPVPGLTHRYRDRALFLALETCPVYCRFCTRSYAVGLDTSRLPKVRLGGRRERWERAFAYIESRPEIEDVVVSGGDLANLRGEHIALIGRRLLGIEHVRRIRFATKSPAVIPQKLATDDRWVLALIEVAEQGRKLHKQVMVHTHFNHPHEIVAITRVGLDRLMEHGVPVRNQTVLQRHVNDGAEVLGLLIRMLGFLNVQPYYVFVHDLVPGVEDLRTSLATAIELEKQVRGLTAGFNTPAFVLDTPGGGGKRHVHSYEFYDREHGISVFTSPAVKPGARFLFFDPLHSLSPAARERWQQPGQRACLLAAACRAAQHG